MSQELLDVRDEQGNVTEQVLPRDQVHAKGLWHANVFVWIYNDKNEVLLQRRAGTKPNFPDTWDASAGGHLSAGDTPIQAACRELFEELQLQVSEEELEALGRCNDVFTDTVGDVHRDNTWVYTLHKNVDPNQLKLQAEELTAVKLIAIKDLERELQDPIINKQYAARNPQIYQFIIDFLKRGDDA